MLEEGITNQFLITGFRGIGKTIFLRKLLEIQPENFLTTYIDLSELYGREKGDLVAEDFIKELLCSIEECVEENDTFLEKAEKKIHYSFNINLYHIISIIYYNFILTIFFYIFN